MIRNCIEMDWFSQMVTVPPATLMALMKLGTRVVSLVSLGRGSSAKKGK